MLKIVLLIAFAIINCTMTTAYVQELVIHPEENCGGLGVRFLEKASNVSIWKDFLNSALSMSVTGWWEFYAEVNFFGLIEPRVVNDNGSPACYNSNFSDVNSLRFIGPSNTLVDALSLFKGGADGLSSSEGEELVVTSSLIAELPFEPKYLTIIGPSVWQLYANANFTGFWECFVPDPNSNFYSYGIGDTKRSLRKGCAFHED